jgi:LMBR1 domain-containing protein 1
MVDVFLIIVCIIFTTLSMGVGFYFVISFQHKEDRFAGFYPWFSKVIVTLSLGVAAMNVLVLPLDSLNRSTANTLDIELMCWIFAIISLGLAFVILPFAMSYYENHDDETVSSPTLKAVLCVIPFLLFVLIFFLILWFAVGRCLIPVQVQTSVLGGVEVLSRACEECEEVSKTWKITPSPLVYVVSLIGFLGYILLLVEGGAGVITLPCGLIGEFINRPRPINVQIYAHAKDKLNQWANELLEEGNILKQDVLAYGRNHRKVRTRYIHFQEQVDALEDTYQKVEISYRVRGGNPVTPWLSLILGIICILISIAWVIHVIVFYLADLHPFLNNFFVALDNAFPYAAVIFFGIFVYYMYWCVLDGTTRIGVNLLFFRVHPMERHNTPMTSLLFNSILMLFASFGVALFATMNFSVYTRLTSLNMIYGVQMQHLQGLSYVWQYGIYAWFVFIALAALYKICTLKKRDQKIAILQEAFDRHSITAINKGRKDRTVPAKEQA